jgi:hypothetical protein
VDLVIRSFARIDPRYYRDAHVYGSTQRSKAQPPASDFPRDVRWIAQRHWSADVTTRVRHQFRTACTIA